MSRPGPAYTSNLLLNAMAPEDLDLLKPSLVRIKLERELVLHGANQPIEHIYFPEGGIASIVSVRPESGRTEIGIFGREGVSGTPVFVGVDRSPYETFIQVDGSDALRIETDKLLDAIERSPAVRSLLQAYVQVTSVQAASCAIGNAHHRLEARLARWLVMCHDRIEGDELALTHDFMAMMIASQRSGVTVTLHVLEGIGAIRSKRGRVIILDREKLEELAGDAYGEPEGEYRRLIGPFGREGSVLPFKERRPG
jgi:CRP-like cAMP-binding protein